MTLDSNLKLELNETLPVIGSKYVELIKDFPNFFKFFLVILLMKFFSLTFPKTLKNEIINCYDLKNAKD